MQKDLPRCFHRRTGHGKSSRHTRRAHIRVRAVRRKRFAFRIRKNYRRYLMRVFIAHLSLVTLFTLNSMRLNYTARESLTLRAPTTNLVSTLRVSIDSTWNFIIKLIVEFWNWGIYWYSALIYYLFVSHVLYLYFIFIYILGIEVYVIKKFIMFLRKINLSTVYFFFIKN